MSKSASLIRRSYDIEREDGREMLYDLLIQGEDARWNTFKKAEREAHYRNGLRDGTVGRLRGVRMLDAAKARAGSPRALLAAALRR